MAVAQIFSRNGWERAGKALIQSAKDFANDNGPQWAAAIAYYSLLSIFPLLLAATSIAAYFVDQQWAIQQGSQLMRNLLPGSTQFVRRVIENVVATRGQVGFFSILLLVWSGSRVFGVITKALNIAYDVNESYGFLKRTLLELLMTLTIGILFVLALGSRIVMGFLESSIRIPVLQQALLYRLLGDAVPAGLLLASLYLMYRYVPRRRIARQAAFAGSVLFTVLFLLAQPIFTGYINTFANYSLVYGPLAIVVTLVLWAWITSNLLIFGGELASHIQDMLIDQKSEQEVDAHHKKRDPTSSEHEQARDHPE
jgi:membrane protein